MLGDIWPKISMERVLLSALVVWIFFFVIEYLFWKNNYVCNIQKFKIIYENTTKVGMEKSKTESKFKTDDINDSFTPSQSILQKNVIFSILLTKFPKMWLLSSAAQTLNNFKNGRIRSNRQRYNPCHNDYNTNSNLQQKVVTVSIKCLYAYYLTWYRNFCLMFILVTGLLCPLGCSENKGKEVSRSAHMYINYWC